jgi:hypothetical protein
VRMPYTKTIGEKMSKSKYGNSNLYMNTQEFAELVVQALHDQEYFKKNETAHPQDIAYAFSTVAETIGSAMSWAISQETEMRKEIDKKKGMMQTGNLRKNALPIDEEIAPSTKEDGLGYSEYRHKNAYM